MKDVVLLYSKCFNIKQILDFLSVLDTYAPSVICSDGIIYYKLIKMHFINFKNKFKHYSKHFILKPQENL